MKNRWIGVLGIAALAIALGAPAFAETEPGEAAGPEERPSPEGRRGRGHPPPRLADMDADGDGTVSKEEFLADHVKRAQERMGDKYDAERAAKRAEKMFGKLDDDGDGSVTRDEMKKARRRHARRGEGKKGRGRGGPDGGGEGPGGGPGGGKGGGQ